MSEEKPNRQVPSVSVTGALLTGNFFREQVVSSRHATNQADQTTNNWKLVIKNIRSFPFL